ncbi:hypothetical protein ACW7EJ_04560, partial [Acinetobacter soli]
MRPNPHLVREPVGRPLSAARRPRGVSTVESGLPARVARPEPGRSFVPDRFAQDDDLDAEPPGVTEQERMERGEAAEEQDVRFETMDLLEHVER